MKTENIKKILIAEDLESISAGIEKALNKIPEAEIYHARYCDDALLKLKKGIAENEHFDLLITDLSFKNDHREVQLKTGEELIQAIRKENIPCKIIVFSVEDKPLKAQMLFDDFNIDAYIVKGREDNREIRKAVEEIKSGRKYISESLREKIHFTQNIAQVEEIDLLILRQLCNGKTQEEISREFQNNGIKPNSISTIEKRLKNLREDFSAKTNIELVLTFKELGLI
jgi:DNA-binding NarL/FixJ family response regulator